MRVNVQVESLIGKIRDASSPLKSLGVERLYLFGSRSRGTYGPESDLDVLVEFSGGRGGFFDLARVKTLLDDRLRVEVDVQFADAVPEGETVWRDTIRVL